ncbi:autotransporter domain-containing protein [Bordetella genomosp. 9]|uniref:Autotransporter domain-containing protein n=1 Tax=Bordetella genomosp. 9 TaxID=1416803 RepID=A0A1W6Z111_9BORD|nr:autotransporter serine protease [Bordetella genomosp. 9]ARP87030.1 hypothetical protein CAL13_13045 [Bordetella genomosp. 9]
MAISKRAAGPHARRAALSHLMRRTVMGSLFMPVSLYAAPEESFRTAEYQASWGLGMINAAPAYAMGYTGKGVRVGVVDDGGAYGHPEFAGRAWPWGTQIDAATGDVIEPGVHSTAVAGLLAAARDGIGMHGVAYDATLFPVQGFYDGGPMFSDEAIREAVDNGVRVINGSYAPQVYPLPEMDAEDANPTYTPQSIQTLLLGSDGRLQNFSDEAEALRYAAANDVLTVYAAGNEAGVHPVAARHPGGFGLLPFIHPGNHAAGIYQIVDGGQEWEMSAYSPENYPKIDLQDPRLRAFDFRDLEGTLIAAVAVRRDRTIASYSNGCGVAWRWCIAAPGGDGPDAGEDAASSFLYTTWVNGRYKVRGMAGTSFAAPLVAGSAAVLRQAFPYMTARQVAEVLLTSADRSGHLADRALYGRGLLDLGRAVRGPVEFGAEGFDPIFDVDTKGHDSWWRNDITGRGGLTKRGAGTLLLTGANRYTGPTVVRGGTLAVEGSIASSRLTVERGGTLSGAGTVGPADVAGIVAPGNPGKALHVAGDYVQRREGVYRVSIAGDGATADRISVAGAARIDQGRLQVIGIKPAAIGRTFTILEAGGGVSGDFAPVENPYLFLDFAQGTQGQDRGRYRFAVSRNARPFGVAARTRNQRAVARALDSATAGLGPYDATVMATRTQGLPRQFDLWSGESHASMLTALNLQSWRIGQAALGRARGMQGGNAADGSASAPAAVAGQGNDKAAWARYTGSRDKLSGVGHAAGLETASSGILIGADSQVAPHTRLGAMAGFSHGGVKVRDRRSNAKLDTYTMGAYGATRAGGLNLRYGSAYGWHGVSSRRDTGAFGSADGRYKARTWQLFGEAGMPFESGAATLEPYAGLSYLDTRRGRFSESGTAGLRADKASQHLSFSTLGLRGASRWEAHDGSRWSLHGGTGWRHAYGSIEPAARMRFADGEAFHVAGLPVARDALLLEGGVGVESPAGMRFTLGYSGELARSAQSHAIQARASWAF